MMDWLLIFSVITLSSFGVEILKMQECVYVCVWKHVLNKSITNEEKQTYSSSREQINSNVGRSSVLNWRQSATSWASCASSMSARNSTDGSSCFETSWAMYCDAGMSAYGRRRVSTSLAVTPYIHTSDNSE